MNWKKAIIFGIFSAIIGAVVFTLIDVIAGRGIVWRSTAIAAFVFGVLEFTYTLIEKR